MNSQTIRVRLKADELEKIDEARKAQKFPNRSSYIRHKLLDQDEQLDHLNDLNTANLIEQIRKLSYFTVDMKKNDINLINTKLIMIFNILVLFFDDYIKLKGHELGKLNLSKNDIEQYFIKYNHDNKQIGYVDHKLKNIKDRIYGKVEKK